MLRDTVAKLLDLPATERVDIAMALWDSLTPAKQQAEFDLTIGQRAELDRRLALVRRVPYAIYFHAMPDAVVVLGVIHGRRHSRRWQSRP
jgi:putative addiction module component (TIGR02574 family)